MVGWGLGLGVGFGLGCRSSCASSFYAWSCYEKRGSTILATF